MRGSIWAVGFPVCPALLVPARFVSYAPAAARRFACACRVAARSSVHPSHPVNKFLHVKGGGNIFKNLDSLLGLKPLLVPPKLLGRFTPLIIYPCIFRPRRLHAMHRCELLLSMSSDMWTMCLSVGALGPRVRCAKMAEPIEMPFGG